MDLVTFLETSHALGMGGVQLCENLDYEERENGALESFGERAREFGMFIELGMRDISPEHLRRHIEIARLTGAGFIRLVLGAPSERPEADPASLKAKAIRTIGDALPLLERHGLRLGIENHFDLRTPDIAEVVETLGSDRVGVVLDTTNGLGFLEHPEQTLERLLPSIMSVHIKDYYVQKVEAGYLVRGCALGKGELNTGRIVRRVLDAHPEASLIIEMTIRRDSGMEPCRVVEWERDQIRRSIDSLMEITASGAVR